MQISLVPHRGGFNPAWVLFRFWFADDQTVVHRSP
jgi:hypothetical protein